MTHDDMRRNAWESIERMVAEGRIHIHASDAFRYTYGGGPGGGKNAAHEHDGGRELTPEEVIRLRMAAKHLILTDAEYAAGGVEVIPGTCKWQRAHWR